MSKLDFIQTLINFLLVISVSTAFGITLIQLIQRIFQKDPKKNHVYKIKFLGAALLLGLGVYGYLSLFLGLAGFFSKNYLLLVLLALALLSKNQFVKLSKYLYKNSLDIAKKCLMDPISLAAIIATVLILGSLYLSAMRPPHASDELHYHFPQAVQIVENGKIDPLFGGHYFYGNIPKLMEVLFAAGISISGYSLAHALNFAIMFGFLAIVFGIIYKHYGIRAATLSILLLVLFDDFTWNGTTGFIDTATTSFEIGALLLTTEWVLTKNKLSLLVGASLIGLALSMKYSPAPTFLYLLLVVFLFAFLRGRAHRKSLISMLIVFGGLTFFFGGFWYVKNIVLFGNPIFPLYFGHKGATETQYASLINTLHQFRPKTLATFFELIKHYLTFNSSTVYLSFYLAFLASFVKKNRKFSLILLTYYVLYVFYWFFFATHQIRFLAPGIVVASILMAIVISKVNIRTWLKLALLLLFASIITSICCKSFSYKTIWNNYWFTKLNVVRRQYAVGNETKSQFLRRHFGCQYAVIEYLEENELEGGVIDNWTVWHGPSVSFYAKQNSFTGFTYDVSQTKQDLAKTLATNNIKYIYFNTKIKEKHLNNPHPLVVESKKSKLPAEELLLTYSKVIFTEDMCQLYEIGIEEIINSPK